MSTTVTLKIRAESTKWGETLGITGSIPELSTWGTTTPPSLTASPFPLWTITLTLPADTLVQYKYVILSSSKIARWEVLPSSEENRSFTTPAYGETLEIDDGVMGDPTRTSATVTPSTTPTNTPTRPQKPANLTESMNEIPVQPAQQHSLAEFAAQLDTSRRQIEHVRAAVRRIRRIPTPDSLPTPPSTPNQSNDLSPDAAAALANDTLNEAKANIDVICRKLRAVKTARTKPVACCANSVLLAGVIGFAVILVGTCIMVMDPRIAGFVQSFVVDAREMVRNGNVMSWGKMKCFRESCWKTGIYWSAKLKVKAEQGLLQSVEHAVNAVERVKTRVALKIERFVSENCHVCGDVGEGVREQVRKVIARVGQLGGS